MEKNGTTLVEILQWRAANEPDNCAYIFLHDDSEEKITYAELDQKARTIAAYLLSQQGQGERAMLFFNPGLEYIAAFFGCLYAGVIAVPAYPPRNSRHMQRLQAIIDDAGAKFILNHETLQKINTHPLRELPAITPDMIAFLQYTSGSTGDPKGVIVTHANIISNVEAIAKNFEKGHVSGTGSWLPPYHDMGLIGTILYPLYKGHLSVQMAPTSFFMQPLRWLKAIHDYKLTFSPAPNFAYQLCVDEIPDEALNTLDLSQWRIAVNGAEPIHPKTIDQFCEKFKRCGFKPEYMCPAYGMAEATVMISTKEVLSPTQYHDNFVNCGKAAPEHELIIVEDEIWFRGPSVAQGYWNKPELTKQTFHPYLRTGDLGFLDEEGNLYVKGRKKDIIIIRGRNYYPQDIEETVYNSHPDLLSHGCAAFSHQEDTESTEKLVIVQEVKRHPKNIDDIFAAIRKAIAEHHDLVVSDIILIRQASLPRTSSGKIQHAATKKEWKEQALKIVAEWHAPLETMTHDLLKIEAPKNLFDIEKWLKQWIEIKTGSTDIQLNKPFADYGFDSLLAVKLCNDLGSWLNQKINPSILWEYSTITSLAQFLGQEKNLTDTLVKKIDKITNEWRLFPHEPIAIIGMSCRLPGNIETPEDFWELLAQQKSGISDVPRDRWDIEKYYDPDPNAKGKMTTRSAGFISQIDQFDADFFGISPKEAQSIDPQHRLLLELTWEALERAAINPLHLKNSSTGIFVGISTSDYSNLLHKYAKPEEITAYTSLGQSFSAAAGRLAYFLGTQGQTIAIDTACSSSLVAIYNACQDLQMGDCDLAISGAVNLILEPEEMISFSKAHMLAPDGKCKTFDAKADGYVRSEGGGVFILKRLSDAERDNDIILAVIKGAAVNQDGPSNGLTAPNVEAQVKLLETALRHADTKPSEIDFIETHGTGTALGDPIEIRAINHVYENIKTSTHPLYLGAVKTNIGHCEAAAGMAGLMKVVLALQHKEIPGNLHFEKLNPHIDLNVIPAAVPTKTIAWEHPSLRKAGVSAFGFTGTNAHLIVEEAQKEKINLTEKSAWVLCLTAKTKDALNQLIERYSQFIENHPEICIEDIVYTTNTGRAKFEYHAHFYAETREQLLANLKTKNITTDEECTPRLANKIILPTYPFQRQHCWATALESEKNIEEEKVVLPKITLSPLTHKTPSAPIQKPSALQSLHKPYFLELKNVDGEARQKTIQTRVLHLVSDVTGKDITTLDPSRGFFEMGLDSIMSTELRNQLQKDLGDTYLLSPTAALDYPSIEKLASYINTLIYGETPATSEKISVATPVPADDAIAIIGLSCRFPGHSNSPEAFWELLEQGKSGVSDIPFYRWDIDQYYDPDPDAPGKMWTRAGGFIDNADAFDAKFFGISPREAEAMDPQQRILLELSWEALERSGYSPATLKGSQTGVFVGHWHSDYADLITRYSEPTDLTAYQGTGTLGSALSGRLSYQFGFEGPSLMIDTACSSSLTAIHLACESLKNNECELALACGTNLILSPDTHIMLSKGRALSPEGKCKTFDDKADGYTRGEGAGVVVLKRLRDAKKDNDTILGVILASKINQDGASSGLTVPNRIAQEHLLQETLKTSGKNPEDISFIETHGTGTPLGDPIEVNALCDVYGKHQSLTLGAVKSNIGHLEGAAGIASVIKVVLSMMHKQIPANLHFEKLNTKITGNVIIPTALTPWESSHKRVAAVSAFGITGTNAHLILEEGDATKLNSKKTTFHPQRYWLNTLKKSYTRTLKIYPFTYLDHQINGKILFPMTAYLSWIIDTAKQLPGENAIILKNFTLHAPLFLLSENPVLKMELDFDKTQQAYRGRCGHYAEWLLESQEECTSPTRVDRTALLSMLRVYSDIPAFYAQLSQKGFQYGPGFHTIQELRVGEDTVLAKLQGNSLTQLLDGGCHALAILFIKENVFYLPAHIGSLRCFQEFPSTVWAYGKLKHKTENTLIADIIFYDENNTMLAQIENFEARAPGKEKAIPSSTMIEEKINVDHLFYQLKWKPETLVEEYTFEEKRWLIVSHIQPPIEFGRATCLNYGDIITLDDVIIPGVTDIVYVLPPIQTPEEFETIYLRGLLKLVQNLVTLDAPQPALWIITHTSANPFHAAIGGFYKTLRLEQPLLKLSWIDTDEPNDWPWIVMKEKPNGDCVAYRHQKRFVARVTSYPVLKAPYQLTIREKGVLENITFEPCTLPVINDQDIQIRITASSLNFRDVLNAMNLYPGEAGELGAECVGVIEKMGKDVSQFSIGDTVIGILSGTFGSHVTADASRFFKKPTSFTDAQAASIPVVFITTYIALHEIAQLKKDEWFLIHSAAGGVGLAAIQYAQFVGAKIIATAGSPAKRQYLKSLGIAHVFDSRNVDYVDAIKTLTNGKGVDVVLNYATGDHIPHTLTITAQRARFIEIGKRDIFSKEKMAMERPDIDYHILAIDHHIQESPAFIQKYLPIIFDLFSEGIFHPLPLTLFPIQDAVDAFEFLQKAEHIGKVVITQPRAITIDSHKTYLITGGLGGLGLLFADYLHKKGAGKIVLLGRHTKNKTDLPNITHEIVDVTDNTQLAAVIEKYKSNLGGIIHAAGLLDDKIMTEQTFESFHRVLAPKMLGAWNIVQLTNDLSLDFIILFSSMASMIGSPGQINYATANAFLDGLSHPPVMSINWGNWADVGMAATLTERHSKSGVTPLTKEKGLAAFECLLNTFPTAPVMIADIHWPTLLENISMNIPWLQALRNIHADDLKNNFVEQLKLTPETERDNYIHHHIETLLKNTLKLPASSAIDASQGFFDLGMDSLMALEFKNRLQASLGNQYSLSQTIAFDHPTLEKLTGYLKNDVLKEFFIAKKIVVNFDQQKEALAEKLLHMSIDDIKKLREGF